MHNKKLKIVHLPTFLIAQLLIPIPINVCGGCKILILLIVAAAIFSNKLVVEE